MTDLIRGINPFTISSITYCKARRYGHHPAYTKVMQKKNPIRGYVFGCYNSGLFDGFYYPYVTIRGANGAILKEIQCHSNDSAKELHKQLNSQLSEFLAKIKVNGINE